MQILWGGLVAQPGGEAAEGKNKVKKQCQHKMLFFVKTCQFFFVFLCQQNVEEEMVQASTFQQHSPGNAPVPAPQIDCKADNA